MSGATVVATRSELLARRARASFAEQGRSLLADKRQALVAEFAARTQALLPRVAALQRDLVAAREALERAEADAGTEAVRSAGLAAAEGVCLALGTRVVAGVALSTVSSGGVQRAATERGYGPGPEAAAADAAAEAYEAAVAALLDVCADELTVRRLAAEIARTTRQLNALEHVLLPRLRAEVRGICLVLDEREREDRVRLSRARSRRPDPRSAS